MKIFRLTVFIFLFLGFNYSNVKSEDSQSKITKNLRCLICQGQSVYDSDSEFANSVKILVDKKLNDGFSEEQIYLYSFCPSKRLLQPHQYPQRLPQLY